MNVQVSLSHLNYALLVEGITIKYASTNESLKGIVDSMNPGKTDTVFAVGGSLDQSLALLQGASRVVAIDPNERQVAYMHRKKQFLQDGDFRAFLSDPRKYGYERPRYDNEAYFLGMEHEPLDVVEKHIEAYIAGAAAAVHALGTFDRLHRIRSKLDLLEIVQGDLVKEVQKEHFCSQIYFSNVFSWGGYFSYEEIRRDLCIFENVLPEGGLLYLSNGAFLRSSDVPAGLMHDVRLSRLAHECENPNQIPSNLGWKPCVLVKKKEKRDA